MTLHPLSLSVSKLPRDGFGKGVIERLKLWTRTLEATTWLICLGLLAASAAVLTMLCRMPPGQALLASKNLDIGSPTGQNQTRFQSVRLQPPENEILEAFPARRWCPDCHRPKESDGKSRSDSQIRPRFGQES